MTKTIIEKKKIIWEWGTAGVSNKEISERLNNYYDIQMTEEEVQKFIEDYLMGDKNAQK